MPNWIEEAKNEAEKTADYIRDIVIDDAQTLNVDNTWYLNEVIKCLKKGDTE